MAFQLIFSAVWYFFGRVQKWLSFSVGSDKHVKPDGKTEVVAGRWENAHEIKQRMTWLEIKTKTKPI